MSENFDGAMGRAPTGAPKRLTPEEIAAAPAELRDILELLPEFDPGEDRYIRHILLDYQNVGKLADQGKKIEQQRTIVHILFQSIFRGAVRGKNGVYAFESSTKDDIAKPLSQEVARKIPKIQDAFRRACRLLDMCVSSDPGSDFQYYVGGQVANSEESFAIPGLFSFESVPDGMHDEKRTYTTLEPAIYGNGRYAKLREAPRPPVKIERPVLPAPAAPVVRRAVEPAPAPKPVEKVSTSEPALTRIETEPGKWPPELRAIRNEQIFSAQNSSVQEGLPSGRLTNVDPSEFKFYRKNDAEYVVDAILHLYSERPGSYGSTHHDGDVEFRVNVTLMPPDGFSYTVTLNKFLDPIGRSKPFSLCNGAVVFEPGSTTSRPIQKMPTLQTQRVERSAPVTPDESWDIDSPVPAPKKPAEPVQKPSFLRRLFGRQ